MLNILITKYNELIDDLLDIIRKNFENEEINFEFIDLTSSLQLINHTEILKSINDKLKDTVDKYKIDKYDYIIIYDHGLISFSVPNANKSIINKSIINKPIINKSIINNNKDIKNPFLSRFHKPKEPPKEDPKEQLEKIQQLIPNSSIMYTHIYCFLIIKPFQEEYKYIFSQPINIPIELTRPVILNKTKNILDVIREKYNFTDEYLYLTNKTRKTILANLNFNL